MLKGLQAKLVLIFIILTLATMAVIGTVLVNSVTVFYSDDFAVQMNSFFSDNMLTILEESYIDEDEHDGLALYERLSLYSATLGIDTYRNVFVLDESGAFLQGSNEELGKVFEVTENVVSAALYGRGSEVDPHADYMDFAVSVGDGADRYIVYVKDTKQEASDLTWAMIVIIIKALVVALLISALLSYLLAKTITAPIKNITNGALKIASGDFSGKLTVASKDEIGTLTETFNDMADELEETLRHIETERSRLSTMFLYMNDGVVAFSGDGTLTHINKTATQMLAAQYTPEESEFGDMLEKLINMDFKAVKESVSSAPFDVDIEVNGRIYTCNFAQYVDSASDGDGVLAVLHDVTEQEEIDRSRREFIANVSHELRTPITNVKSYTETILENDDLDEESRKRFLGVVLSESDRMIHIVKDLLLLSKFDSRKIEMKPEVFDIRQVTHRVADAMSIQAQKSGITLVYCAEEDVPSIFADKARIEQVVVNIVSNAIKYTPEGGTVSVLCTTDGDNAVVRITDSGIGIPAEDLPHIFERFYRVDKARSRKMGGTGLGLAIAKEIVDGHGGTITIDSVYKEGTTVTISFKGEKQA